MGKSVVRHGEFKGKGTLLNYTKMAPPARRKGSESESEDAKMASCSQQIIKI